MIFCKNISRLFCALIVAMAACMLSGCYSFTASTLPSHIKTVNIHEVDDKTLDPVLANNIHTAVVDMFKRNAGGVRLVNDNANADFEITLLSYSNKPENYNSNSDVETYRVKSSTRASPFRQMVFMTSKRTRPKTAMVRRVPLKNSRT